MRAEVSGLTPGGRDLTPSALMTVSQVGEGEGQVGGGARRLPFAFPQERNLQALFLICKILKS